MACVTQDGWMIHTIQSNIISSSHIFHLERHRGCFRSTILVSYHENKSPAWHVAGNLEPLIGNILSLHSSLWSFVMVTSPFVQSNTQKHQTIRSHHLDIFTYDESSGHCSTTHRMIYFSSSSVYLRQKMCCFLRVFTVLTSNVGLNS